MPSLFNTGRRRDGREVLPLRPQTQAGAVIALDSVTARCRLDFVLAVDGEACVFSTLCSLALVLQNRGLTEAPLFLLSLLSLCALSLSLSGCQLLQHDGRADHPEPEA